MSTEELEYINYPTIMNRPDRDLGTLEEKITHLKEANEALKTNIDLKAAAFEIDGREKDKEIERLNAQCEVIKLDLERVRLEMTKQSQMHRQAIETHQAETERLKVVYQLETERLKSTHEVETIRLNVTHQAAMERQKQDHQEVMDKMRQEHAHLLEMSKCKSSQDMEEMLQRILHRLPGTHITTNGAGSEAF